MIVIFFYLEKLASGSYYSQSMKILRQHPGAAEILGHPIRSKFLDLGDKFNVVSATEANVIIMFLLCRPISKNTF